jgi:hypothetical protein
VDQNQSSHWRSVLRCWLDTRKRLWREFGIPITEKLHTTAYVNGRGRISKSISGRHVHDGHEYWKDFGREVAHERLEALRCAEGLSLGAICRRRKPGNLAQIKRELYAELATRVEHELLEFDSLAMIFMDGDGADGSCRTARRGLALAERRVIEDAIHIESAGSQLIQMADLVAWCANTTIDRHEKNVFAAEWSNDHLSERDPNREPKEI